MDRKYLRRCRVQDETIVVSSWMVREPPPNYLAKTTLGIHLAWWLVQRGCRWSFRTDYWPDCMLDEFNTRTSGSYFRLCACLGKPSRYLIVFRKTNFSLKHSVSVFHVRPLPTPTGKRTGTLISTAITRRGSSWTISMWWNVDLFWNFIYNAKL